MKILVVCGAGASSTFVAMRIRRAASARALDISASAGSSSALDAALDGVDVLLLGAHLADQLDGIRQRLAGSDTSVAVMPESVFSSQSGDEALDLALNTAGARR